MNTNSSVFLAMWCRAFPALALVLPSVPLSGQTRPAAPAPDPDVVTLSPFEVSADSTTGYVARTSLAGTRLNTPLKDIPSQVSVMTPEFLQDIAATTPEDAMLYSLNVENNVEFTDATDANGNLNRGINFNTFSGRVRGMADAGRTRDFFDTDLQGDVYNVDTITISSGPNAVIYGLGGTGGIINTAFKRARLKGNEYTVGFRTDTEGSARATIDLNHVLIKDRLALRIAGLADDFETFRDSSGGRQNRKFGTITAQPWKSTKFHAYVEDVDIKKLLPRNVIAYDAGASSYLAHVAAGGAPLLDNSLRIVPAAWQSLVERTVDVRTGYVLSGDGTTPIGPRSGTNLFSYQTVAPGASAVLLSDRYSWSLPLDSPLASRTYNVHGDTTGRHMYGHIYGAILNQQIGRDLSLELGYNYESGWTDFWNWAQPIAASIRADVNRYLPDGVTPNPNAGRLYVENQGQSSTTDYNKMYGFRAAASYELDLSKKSKWLGTHHLVALYTNERKDRYWSWIVNRIIPAAQADTYRYDARLAAAAGATTHRYYVDPERGISMDTPFDPLTGGRLADGSLVFALKNSPATGQTWSSLGKKDGLMTAIQSHWFGGRLVTTVGRRASDFTNGVATDGATLLPPGNGIAYGFPKIREIDHSRDTWEPTVSADAFSYGAVLHLGRQWSIFYNWSDIFNSPVVEHYADDSLIPSAIGEGIDYGFMWEGFDGKVGARVNFYETRSENVKGCNWCPQIRDNILNLEKRIGAPGRPTNMANAYAQALPEALLTYSTPPPAFDSGTFSIESPSSYWHMTSDRKSRGIEIEAFANPTPQLTFRTTAARNEATDEDIGKGWIPYIDARYEYWRRWAEWEQRAYWTGSTTPIGSNPASVTNDFAKLLPAYITISNYKGLRVTQNAGWRINFTGKYTFREGLLRGLYGGTNIRFREAPTVGYLVLPADNPFANWPGLGAEYVAPSLASPVLGGDQFDLDGFLGYTGQFRNKVKYRLALNVRNVLNRIDLMKQRVDGFGNTRVYTFKEPRVFIVSTEFTF